MPNQIQSPEVYSLGEQVTATRLNNMVNGATVLPGAISEQVSVSSLSTSDLVLVNQSGVLKKATIQNVKDSLDYSSSFYPLSSNPAGYITAAPNDGNYYIQHNGSWEQLIVI